MSQTKAQLVGGVGISTVGDLSVYGGINVTGVVTATSFVGDGSGITGISSVSFATTSFGLSGTPNIIVGIVTASAFVDDGTDLLTEINTKTSTGKAIAMAMIFG